MKSACEGDSAQACFPGFQMGKKTASATNSPRPHQDAWRAKGSSSRHGKAGSRNANAQ